MTESTEHHDEEHEPHGGLAFYVFIAVVLVFLTACSYATHTAFWTRTIGDSVEIKRLWMMAVSCAKAMCVIMVFMHLYWEANWKWVLTIPASCMSIFLVLALVPDVGMRQDNGYSHYSEERLLYEAERPPQRPSDETEPPHHETESLDAGAGDHTH